MFKVFYQWTFLCLLLKWRSCLEEAVKHLQFQWPRLLNIKMNHLYRLINLATHCVRFGRFIYNVVLTLYYISLLLYLYYIDSFHMTFWLTDWLEVDIKTQGSKREKHSTGDDDETIKRTGSTTRKYKMKKTWILTSGFFKAVVIVSAQWHSQQERRFLSGTCHRCGVDVTFCRDFLWVFWLPPPVCRVNCT